MKSNAKRASLWGIVSLMLATLLFVCSPSNETQSDGDGDGDSDGDSDSDADLSDGGDPDAARDTGADVRDDSDGICDEIGFAIERVVPDMLIVLDRSNSMRDDGHWTPVREAIYSVTAEMDRAIWFGLMGFPNAEAPRPCSGLSNQCEGGHCPG